MSIRDYTANVISATPVVPDGNFKTSAASGVWDINEALDLIKGGNWPNAANIDPASFVDALFSTDLIVGATGTGRTITNDIDLSTKKGFVWGVTRSAADNRRLSNTVRGASETLDTGNTYAEFDNAGVQGATQFNSNGFVSGLTDSYYNNEDIVYWTFREQPKFFDLVQFSGTGSAQNISHSLGSVPGMIWVKRVDSTGDWAVYHRGFDSSAPEDYIAFLNKTTAIADNDQYWNDTAPTSSVFTVGTNSAVNASGGTYIAFIFAHNNDDGGFGEPGDQDIIKCASFTGNSSDDVTVDVGFEPQFLLTFRTGGSNWNVVDNLRGIATGGVDATIFADTGGAENTAANRIDLTPTGFIQKSGQTGNETVVYMAIRRGGMQTPTAGTDVFDIDVTSSQAIDSNNPPPTSPFVVDMNIYKNRNEASTAFVTQARVIGPNYLQTSAADAEGSGYTTWDQMDGWGISNSSWESAANYVFYNWKRARGYFDVVTYTGTGSARTVAHNLGVVPEMMWVKCRSETQDWVIYHKDMDSSAPEDYGSYLNDTTGRVDSANFWNDTAPTSSVFTVGTAAKSNGSSKTYVAYLFASVDGVSKLGGYTGNGSSQTIDCGFQPRFIMTKKAINGNGGFLVFDSVRGIPAGNDPYLLIYTTDAENSGADTIDLTSTGFTVNDSNTNANTDGYIFYAIA